MPGRTSSGCGESAARQHINTACAGTPTCDHLRLRRDHLCESGGTAKLAGQRRVHCALGRRHRRVVGVVVNDLISSCMGHSRAGKEGRRGASKSRESGDRSAPPESKRKQTMRGTLQGRRAQREGCHGRWRPTNEHRCRTSDQKKKECAGHGTLDLHAGHTVIRKSIQEARRRHETAAGRRYRALPL